VIVKVLLGTVRADREYGVGEELDLSESEARATIREGVVEEVKEKPKKEPKAKPKKKAEPKKAPEEVEPEPEPSLDWTRKELNDYANAHGVKEPEQFGSKKEVLEALKGGEKK